MDGRAQAHAARHLVASGSHLVLQRPRGLAAAFELAAGSPLAHSHREKPRGAGGLATLLAMRIARGMVRSRDLQPRRTVLCSASAACNSNDVAVSAMISGVAFCAASWSRTQRPAVSVQFSLSVVHAPFSTRSALACSAVRRSSNDCHVGHVCMTQRALESTYA